MTDAIVADLQLKPGSEVLAVVSGLGGTPLIELDVMAGELATYCSERGFALKRMLVGPYITALDMAGCTVTLTRMSDTMLALWDAPVTTPSLTW